MGQRTPVRPRALHLSDGADHVSTLSAGQTVDAVCSNPHYAECDLRLLVCHVELDASGMGQQVANEMGVTVRALTGWRIFLPVVGR
jgi:hypothetical protein